MADEPCAIPPTQGGPLQAKQIGIGCEPLPQGNDGRYEIVRNGCKKIVKHKEPFKTESS